jgi:hypothetical protein
VDLEEVASKHFVGAMQCIAVVENALAVWILEARMISCHFQHSRRLLQDWNWVTEGSVIGAKVF